MTTAHVRLEGESAEAFNRAVETLAEELDRELLEMGRPSGDELTRPEAVEELARRYLRGELEPAEEVMQHMGTCTRCGHRSLSLEGGLCPRCL